MNQELTYQELEEKIGQLEKQVSELKKVDDKLKVLMSIFEQGSNSVAILDSEGVIEYANPPLLVLSAQHCYLISW